MEESVQNVVHTEVLREGESGLSECIGFGPRGLRQREMSGHLFLGGFPCCDVLGRSDESANLALRVPDWETVNPHPADRMVGSDDSELLIELSGMGCLFKSSQNADTIFGVKEFLIRRGVFAERVTRAAGDRLKRLVDVDDFFCVRIEHPEDLLDVCGHLLESFFAFAECGFGLFSAGDVSQYGYVSTGQVVCFGGVFDEDCGAVLFGEFCLTVFVLSVEEALPGLVEIPPPA